MHPVLYLIAEVLMTIVVIGFTPPDSTLRLVGFFTIILCVVKCIPTCMLYMTRTPWAALVGGYSVAYLYHYLDVALLSRWSFADGAPVSSLVKPSLEEKASTKFVSADEATVLRRRLIFGIKVTSDFRFISTPYQVRNVPEVFSTVRHAFIWRTVVVINISYIILDFINSSNDPQIASEYLTLDKIPLLARLADISPAELVLRFATVLAAGISLNCVQGGIYYIVALTAVSSGISEPADWPPFYGSPSKASTLHGFWNVYWHQTNARKFSSIAHYTVHDLLELPRGTIHARYLRILVAFAASALMHLLIDISSGISLAESGAIRFFITQALGIVLEDAFLNFYRSQLGRHGPPTIVEQGFGFVWVTLFVTWSVPAYLYPMMWRSNEGLNDSVIPFSLFTSGGEKVMGLVCLAVTVLVSFAGTVKSFRTR